MPIIMTRVWPIAMIQLPTAIYMISEFMNSLRIIYLDGRQHTDPDIVVRTFNGESIGRWEGDTLVVDTRHFTELDKHWVDQGIPASRDFRMIERYRLINNGNDARRRVDADRSAELGRRVEGNASMESRDRPRHPGGRVPARPQRAPAEHVIQRSCSVVWEADDEEALLRSRRRLVLVAFVAPAFAHHSPAAFEPQKR